MAIISIPATEPAIAPMSVLSGLEDEPVGVVAEETRLVGLDQE